MVSIHRGGPKMPSRYYVYERRGFDYILLDDNMIVEDGESALEKAHRLYSRFNVIGNMRVPIRIRVSTRPLTRVTT